MTNIDKILAEFDIAFPEVGTSGWIGDPRYPADLCCGADYCSPNCDEKKREAIKAFLSTSITQTLAEERERVEEMRNAPPPFPADKENPMKHCYQNEGYARALDDLLSSLDKPLTDKDI